MWYEVFDKKNEIATMINSNEENIDRYLNNKNYELTEFPNYMTGKKEIDKLLKDLKKQ
jgi:hypothetical protein